MIPVVFFQVLNKGSVDIAIGCAIRLNKVILIADKDYGNGMCEYHEVNHGIISKWLRFQEQGTSEDFESICMYRWPCIQHVVENMNVERIMHCDSDVLLFENADSAWNSIGNPFMTVSKCPEGRMAGMTDPLGHVGHSVLPLSAIVQFCARKHPGRWNDMFAWTELIRDSKLQAYDTAIPRDGKVWDHHLGNDMASYDCVEGSKAVRFANGVPTLHHKTLGTLYTPVLHCWETSGKYMQRLANGLNVE